MRNVTASRLIKPKIGKEFYMVKIYVVDTNVLIQAPYAIESFEDNEVVLPMVVIEELDHLKKAEGEVGMNARRSIRCLEQLRQKADLLTGVQMENGGRLRVEKNYVDVELPEDLSSEKADNRILKVCAGLSREHEEQVILVTKDILLRIKAQILGICAEDFTTDQVLEHENQYSGRCEIYVPEALFKDFKKKGAPVEDGAFGENLIVKGIDFKNLPVGTRFRCKDVVLEMTQIGKECHSGCEIYKIMGDCIMPREGVFARVLRGGWIREGDELTVL